MNEGSAKQQIVEAVRANSSILVTVSDSPSVDELSAALGLTMILNKIDKRGTAIFSGAIPPAITFLDPAKTFEGTVDSLRDFIIALDKEKADHLRYKVDGDVVKIFITPYRTTLTEKDLEFTQGNDYNVEMVIALGVKEQDHLDKAFAAHGRILHDAIVATISTDTQPSSLGSMDWRDGTASSLCEMLVSLCEALKDENPLLDEQIATAFLTGIVSATDRFSNNQTSSRVMTMAAQLMAAGANQQLIAAKLQEAHEIGPDAQDKSKSDKNDKPPTDNGSNDQQSSQPKKQKKKKDDNSLQINRDKKADSKNDDTTAKELVVPDALAAKEAFQEAVAKAEPSKDIEKELAEQLDAVAPSVPVAPAASPAELEKELNEALVADEPEALVAGPEYAEVPAPQPVPEPVETLTPPANDGMPGFEALDTPVSLPPQPTEQPKSNVSDAIDARAGNSYVESTTQANYDAPVENLISGADGTPDQYVDPFSVPLPALPDLHESKNVAPVSQPQEPAPQNVVADPDPQALTLDQLEKTTATPPSIMDLPPLPPLPDFSNSNLPPLPPPPPPPVFDQPQSNAAQQTGAISSDKLGDIFGDAQAQPETPPAPQQPPKPGQFQIPGQS
jgi:hypothetical protein